MTERSPQRPGQDSERKEAPGPAVRPLNLPAGERTEWLMQQQNCLRLLAGLEINHRFARKFDPSDVVQQTLMEAWRGWERMQADDESQRLAWLRQILAHQIAHFVRHHQTAQKRDVRREVDLEQSLEYSLHNSALKLDALAVAQDPSPSQAAVTQEQKERLAQVLEQLPHDYREVIYLRNFEDLSHQQIAARMERSEAAVRMLWIRALAALTTALKD